MDLDHDTSRNVAIQMRDHVFGEGGPTHSLLNEGRFPDGWASKYLDLLQLATLEWCNKPMWPRELVAAVHFASWYLNLRYETWSRLTGNRNETTEHELNSLRSPSEIFLMQGSLELGNSNPE